MTIKEALSSEGVKGTSPLAGCGAAPHGLWLLEKATGLSATELRVTNENTELSPEAKRIFLHMTEQLQSGIPLQYILGEWGFLNLNIKCKPGVLIPRRDTEVLAEAAIDYLKNSSKGPQDKLTALDICTGSGCVGIALAPYCVHVTGADISPIAIDLARENAELNGVSDRITFVESDLFNNINGHFNCITANPPYIPTSELDNLPADVKKEPISALDGGPDGLDYYRAIIPTSRKFLLPGGALFLEIGATQSKTVAAILRDNGFKAVVTIKDLEDRDRVIQSTKGI